MSTAIFSEVGVGRGHKYYRESVKATAQANKIPSDQLTEFTLATDGTLQEQMLAKIANLSYLASGQDEIIAFINNIFRAGLNHRTRLLRGSREMLIQDGNLNVAFHAAVATGREGDMIVLGDVVPEPVAVDGISIIFSPHPQTTARLETLGHPRNLIKEVGFLVHPLLKDQKAIERRRTNLEKRNRTTVLFSLTGQTPLKHIRILQKNLHTLAQLENDGRIKFIVDACTHQNLARQIKKEMEEADFQNPNVFSAQTAAESIPLFIQAVLQSDILIQMPGETTPTVGLIPRINLTGVNPHAIGNQRFLENPDYPMAIPTHEIAESGIATLLVKELDDFGGRRLLANMDRASILPTNGAETIAEEIASSLLTN